VLPRVEFHDERVGRELLVAFRRFLAERLLEAVCSLAEVVAELAVDQAVEDDEEALSGVEGPDRVDQFLALDGECSATNSR
jgi:hypothetical protein